MSKNRLSIVLLLLITSFIYSQENKKESVATKITNAPVIDGKLEDEVWNSLPVMTDFIQYNPYNGNPPSQKSEVKVCYDDEAVYIGAMFYDSAPDSMQTELTERDNVDCQYTEQMAIYLSPYNDGMNVEYFNLTIRNVQADSKMFANGDDISWDAVWESQTSIIDEGWIAEVKIPFSELRFPNEQVQDWGFNIFRFIARYAEWSNWSYVSNSIDIFWKHRGTLKGIRNIEPPLRLSLYPYISSYVEKNQYDETGYSFNGGMDLKYGLNESFTLDATLIPDFGQVQSDDIVLNLTPFEIQYNEKRQFFTEGTDLFNKGEIFYSRRIGSTPLGYFNVSSKLDSNEKITENPNEAQLINSTKISGRTPGGLGIGFMNSMSANTYATVKDTVTGKEREIQTQPFTNYNIFVLDQTLANNSYISFVNTNVLRESYVANVSALDFRLNDSDNMYEVNGIGALSQIYNDGDGEYGYKFFAHAGKIGGEFRYDYQFMVLSDKYNPNDLGYLYRNNIVQNNFSLGHHIYKSFGSFLQLHNTLDIYYTRLYDPGKYIEFYMNYEISAQFENRYSLSMHAMLSPIGTDDYFEARTPGRVFQRPKLLHNCIHLTSDQRKPLWVRIGASATGSYDYKYDYLYYRFSIEPYLTVNDKISLSYSAEYSSEQNDIGFVDRSITNDDIYFGKRDNKVIENILNVDYLFSNRASLNLKLRHYWSLVEYNQFFTLLEDGDLKENNLTNNYDINYNAFTVDMSFTWNFAPGSELLFVWKNAIYTSDDKVDINFWDNFSNTLSAPQLNSLSLKVLYYIDGSKLF